METGVFGFFRIFLIFSDVFEFFRSCQPFSPFGLLFSLLNIQQLHVKNQRSIRRNHRWKAPRAVRIIRSANQLSLSERLPFFRAFLVVFPLLLVLIPQSSISPFLRSFVLSLLFFPFTLSVISKAHMVLLLLLLFLLLPF